MLVMSTNEEPNPYELLKLGLEATDQEIKSAYRKLSLKVHPDRNPNNPDAAQKFHELNQAYELLLDPLRRLALTSSVRAKEARKARFSTYDKKRKDLQTELEEAERRASKRTKTDETKEAQARENARIMEQGRKLREERAEALKKQAEADTKAAEDATEEEDEVPSLGHLDTTVKVKYQLPSHPTLTTSDALASLLGQFGSIDSESIVFSLKPPKKAPTKPPKSGIAVIPFRQIGDAFAAVCASGRRDRGMDGVEIGWAEGREPPILGWLREQGKLDTPNSRPKSSDETRNDSAPIQAGQTELLLPNAAKSNRISSFSSFPEVLPSLTDTFPPQKSIPGLDYESVTLMRLRQAERDRLEREIREQEALE